MEVARLTVGDLELLPVTQDHAKAFEQVMAGPAMGAHTDVPAQPSDRQVTRFIEWMAKLNTSGKGRAWAITRGGAEIGFIRFNRIDKKVSLASVGYEVAQRHWGQGVATAALRAVVVHAHDDLELNRLEAWALTGNPSSARVLEKAGFLHEGTQRAKMRLAGEPRDVWLYGRLAEDRR